jgi:hypothetical protein
MKRTVYYKTKWGPDHPPFICTYAGKKHYPEVTVYIESDTTAQPLPYKEIDRVMYAFERDSFEGLAAKIVDGVLKKLREGGAGDGTAKVTVRVQDDPDFWVEVTSGWTNGTNGAVVPT